MLWTVGLGLQSSSTTAALKCTATLPATETGGGSEPRQIRRQRVA